MSNKLPKIVTTLPGPKALDVIERDRRWVSPSYTRTYPLVVASGQGAIVEDVDGNQFLDFNAGIAVCSTGHCHPDVVRVIQRQAEKLLHMSGTDFYYDLMPQVAEKLESLMPGHGAWRAFFGNSGTEAVEAALKLARYHTGRTQFIGFFNSFHGRTMGALSVTSSKAVQRQGFGPLVPGVTHAFFANCYRCPIHLEFPGCGVACADYIEDTLFRTTVNADDVAGIIVEPVQGEGGYAVPPVEFMQKLQRIARKHGILLIADEVQSGMGRTGKMFAFEHFGVEPDIVAVAKGIASGLPLGAVIARAEVMRWSPGAHASTFGGNPVCLAAALETIRLLEQGYMENARQLGGLLLSEFRRLQPQLHHVGDVRGLGLMIGLDIVKDRATRQGSPELRDKVVDECFKRGLLVLGAGPSTIRLCPPLVIDEVQARFAIDTLAEVIRSLSD